MTLPAPTSPALAPARRRSLESRGLHFIEHHQPWIWALIAGAAVVAAMLQP